jgi:hypothetical protein
LIRIDRVGVPWKEWNDDAGPPWRSFFVSLDNSVDEGISDLVLDDNPVDDGAGDEELILDVDEVLAVQRKRGRTFFSQDDTGRVERERTYLSWIALR